MGREDVLVFAEALDGLGEIPVDLSKCHRRFVVDDPARFEDDEQLRVYYLTQEGRWIEHRGELDFWDDNNKWVEGYREAHPVHVASVFLINKMRLPPELEPYRKHAGIVEYLEWQEKWYDNKHRVLGIAFSPAAYYYPPAEAGLEVPRNRSYPSVEVRFGPVTLYGPEKPVRVFGREKTLTQDQYSVIEGLVTAAKVGLTKDRLEEIRAGALHILRKLRKNDADWGAAIRMPGKRGRGGYGINRDAVDPRKAASLAAMAWSTDTQ